MRSIVFRILACVIGLLAAFVALGVPLMFISNELQEADSARQYGGHPSFWGAVGGSLIVLIFASLFALLSYMMFRFALRGSSTS
jgi:ABC-type Fe3+ transport system permease subunit